MDNDALAKLAFDLVNQQRQQNGMKPLTWQNGLKAAVDIRATEAATKFSHTRPNGQDWFTVNPDLAYGENLGKDYNDAAATLKAWMDSPEHKKKS